jgi:hypothetical protein
VHLRITCSIKEFEKSSQAIPLPPISCNVPFCPENEKKNAFINLKKKKKKKGKKPIAAMGHQFFFFFSNYFCKGIFVIFRMEGIYCDFLVIEWDIANIY